MEPEEKLTMSVRSAALRLGISVGLAYAMAREGRLPVLRLGARRLVVPRVALERMLAEAGQQQGSGKQHLGHEQAGGG